MPFLLSFVYSLMMAIILVTETCSCLLTAKKNVNIIFYFIVRSTFVPLKISLYKILKRTISQWQWRRTLQMSEGKNNVWGYVNMGKDIVFRWWKDFKEGGRGKKDGWWGLFFYSKGIILQTWVPQRERRLKFLMKWCFIFQTIHGHI